MLRYKKTPHRLRDGGNPFGTQITKKPPLDYKRLKSCKSLATRSVPNPDTRTCIGYKHRVLSNNTAIVNVV